jgi:hypothetical protein
MIKSALALVNRMRDDGVIDGYAIGGAVGATFYLQPVATQDLDIFVMLAASPGSVLISLTPIYDYLKGRGCTVEGEHVVIAGWPVQFLPASTALEAEALQSAVTARLGDLETRVMSAEHLVAIALAAGRAKDYARIVQFMEAAAIDRPILADILERHNLTSKWNAFARRYLEVE